MYVGDPCNTARIFNELEVDELVCLDITATRKRREPDLKLLAELANECFMPLGYGGGIRTIAQARAILHIGFEKIVVNSHAVERPDFIGELAAECGRQAVIGSIDVKRNLRGRSTVRTHAGRVNTHRDPVEWAQELEQRGAGEILLTSIDREGTWTGFHVALVREVADAVSVPVIAHGGAGCVEHIQEVVRSGHASAVALGSMVVFQKQGMGVLVNFPEPHQIDGLLLDAEAARAR